MKSLNLVSEEWFDAICWSSLLLGILMKFFLNLNGLSDGKVVSITKN